MLVDNNTRYAALAEALADGPAAQNVMYVRLFDGIGGGLIVGGRLVADGHGVTGEFGHVVVARDGEPCRCGKRGCLETVASLPAVLRECTRRGLVLPDADALAAAVRDCRPIALAAAVRDCRPIALAAAVRDCRPIALAVLDDAAELVGGVIAAAALVVNPDRIVRGGHLLRAAPHLVDAVARIPRLVRRRPQLPVRPRTLRLLRHLTLLRSRAGYAPAGERAGLEPFRRDRPPASLAHAVGPARHPPQRVVDLGDPLPRRGQQRGQLGALEPDRGALRIVLVVRVRIPRRGEQRLQIRRQPRLLGHHARPQPQQLVPHHPRSVTTRSCCYREPVPRTSPRWMPWPSSTSFPTRTFAAARARMTGEITVDGPRAPRSTPIMTVECRSVSAPVR
ncbi:putative NBD/HSP70 family sugar kinase [Catenuloplanes nepalensis]|uniref:NBD/HSP70 family sugar kinase n=1 Tax=Catenuloplanes nepalensis TaxID=587533 RepID=A0ABT9MSH3_9ACTN|nr:ROK family protein [Catenuloplanes nepalensis]MDP9794329.1 putative NBD/HSP70 family sugar kinase [Catenuloplanes nepalensis]